MRIALLTPEYVTTHPDAGGLASYLARLVGALADAGHEPEVFTLAEVAGQRIDRGVRVHHVTPGRAPGWRVVAAHWRARRHVRGWLAQHRGAAALAEALERRHREQAFDAVQSSNFGVTGYYVAPRPGRVHAVRCSWSRELCRVAARRPSTLDSRLLWRDERAAIRRADLAYAPSAFIAEYTAEAVGRPVRVVRPPVHTAPPTSPVETGDGVPRLERYLIHFGQLSPIKGTDVLAEALAIAWRTEPELTMLWVGREAPGYFDALRRAHGLDDRRLRHLGALPRHKLHALVRGAVASVLPSRCDNLPNTVIESLALDVPVIGTRGASIDELVTDGRTGRLVPIEDATALSEAMVAAWRGEVGFEPSARDRHPVWRAMEPRAAVDALIDAIERCRSHRVAA